MKKIPYPGICVASPPDYFMAPWEGRITDDEMWSMVNYMKKLSPKK